MQLSTIVNLGLAASLLLGGCNQPPREGEGEDLETTESAVIYGSDGRKDVYQLTDSKQLADADGVIGIIDNASIVADANGRTHTIKAEPFGKRLNLCTSERFYSQPSVFVCSGFLVAPDLIVTYAGCTLSAEQAINERTYVFGFQMLDANKGRTVIDNSQVYKAVRVVAQGNVPDTNWRLIQLDRKVTDHRVLPIRRLGKLSSTATLNVAMHDNQAPLKYITGGKIRDNSKARYFSTNIDGGIMQGGAVFDATSHTVEGMYAGTEVGSYKPNGSCNVSIKCADTSCGSSWVERSTNFAPLVPQLCADAGGGWSGCKGGGCSVCDGMINARYVNYFKRHPNCKKVSSCTTAGTTCSGACPPPGEADQCDGTPGQWLGCEGNGCGVCARFVTNYPRYFKNHPGCTLNTACVDSAPAFKCSAGCPAPTDADR